MQAAMSMPPREAGDEKRKPGNAAALALGTQLVAGMLVFTGIGWWIDRRRGGGVAGTVLGMFLGLAYGGYEVWKVVRQIGEDSSPPRS
jgi:F0F1-type ATP synthase assembly protein I